MNFQPLKITVSLNFKKQARKAIKDISEQQMLPIIAGGSGFILRLVSMIIALVLKKTVKTTMTAIRTLNFKTMLDERDLQASLKIHLNNRRRLIRALEICDNLNQKKSQFEEKSK